MRTITIPTSKITINDTDTVIEIEPVTLAAAIAEHSDYADEVIQALSDELGAGFEAYLESVR